MSILNVQQALKAAGYDPGDLDGLWGPATKAALDAALSRGEPAVNPVESRPAPAAHGMRTSPAGIAALVQHEGIVPGPYRDSVGVWTYGIGHTAAAGAPDPSKMVRGMPADLDAAIRGVVRLFAHDVEKYEAAVRAALKVDVAQHEFDALVSFHYNTGAIAKADLTKALNRGDRAAAVAGFMNWRKPPEIIPRREVEQRLFRDGVYPGGRTTVWHVDANGKVIWKPAATLAPAELLAMFAPTDPAAA